MDKKRYFHIKLFSMILISAIFLACTSIDALSPIRDFLNTLVPETTAMDSGEIQAEETSATPPEPRLHVLWDDDGSPDGLIALLYFLHNPEVKVEAITISAGEAYPHTFAPLMVRMLEKMGKSSIPVGVGSDDPLSGSNAFPDPWRVATNEFWGIDLPESDAPEEFPSAAQLIVKVLNEAPEPMTVFISGTHTNLGEALRIDPGIKDKIASVEVMGGALYVPGNIASDWPDISNETAEWNIWVDPTAADIVFSFGLPVTITPLDATKDVIWTRADAGGWRGSAVPEGVMASELLNWMLTSWYPEGVYAWDVVAAVNLVHPEFCQSEDLFIKVITDYGNDEGRTVVLDDKIPNVTACLIPDSKGMRSHVTSIFRGK